MQRFIAAVALLTLSLAADAGQKIPRRELVSGNKDRIRNLKQGMTRAEVVGLMKDYVALTPRGTVGNPYRWKTFQRDGASYEVLYYLTERPQPMQAPEAPTTPVILRDGAVSDWGRDALRSLTP
jgi:hypothetical protein